jgi:hypothetical protein
LQRRTTRPIQLLLVRPTTRGRTYEMRKRAPLADRPSRR